jgi:D-alanine-D-alanine ligase
MNGVAVLMGGISSEREVSLNSGAAVSASLKRMGYVVTDVEAGRDVVERVSGLRGRVDAVFIVLHGRLGEDGTVQGLLELVGIPYTGSGVMASAMAMSKVMSKQIFRANAIAVADDIVANSNEIASLGVKRVSEGVALDLGFPCMIKPDREGSTMGSSRALNLEELEKSIELAMQYDDTVIIERFIEGREMTVGLVGAEPVVLPVLEVVASKGVYDYECKYTEGMTEYIVPAHIPEETARELQRLARHAHQALGCEGFSRVDFMLDEKGGIYCLEVNTIPGMTELSLVPKAAAAAGHTFDEVVEMVLKTARLKIGGEKR